MTTNQLILDFLSNGEKTREQIRNEASLVLARDYATTDRALRRLAELKQICPSKRSKGGFITHYTIKLKTPTTATKPVLRASLNDRLKVILGEMVLNWESAYASKEIDNAIKSKNEYVKKCVIKKYDNK